MAEAPTQPFETQEAYCRHCGEPLAAGAAGDVLCQACDHYQDQILCPTCHQPTRLSLLPADLVPPAHAPKQHKGKD